MATAPQTAMEMPQQAANPYEDPNTMAIYDQMRQSVSPKQFGDEVLAGASQVDPQEVARFKDELDKLDVPAEALDMLNNMVDEILATPEKYAEIKQKYEAMGVTEDLLPEQFDAQFFTALNMAVDQMIGAPAGPEAFAKGGIAELKPVAKAIANYGRNGDTMLAHITPAEARMLRRKGGAGTTNPKTGLKEFFSLKKLFKGIGNAVKSFVNSTVGKIVTTVALGFFLGPAAASFLGVSSAAGVAAVSGFIGGAGSTLLGGGNLSQALKAGAIGGLTAGAGAGIMGGSEAFTSGSYTGPTTVGGQYDKLMGVPSAPTASAPQISSTGQVAGMAPVAPTEFATQADLNAAGPAPSFMDKAKDFYDNKLFPSDIQAQGTPIAQKAAADAVAAAEKTLPASITGDARAAMLKTTYDKALSAAMPGVFSTYAPITAAGIGALGLAGGFSPSKPDESKLKPELLKSATQRIAEQGKQKEYYIQNLPGVKYDESGAPIYGSYNPLPTTPASTTPISNFNLPNTIGGIGSLYTPPPGTIGAQKPVAQPYNTASMYTNLMPPPPPRYAEGGDVKPSAESAAMIEAQRAAMIAQAQALGQSGYTPTNPGSYGVERGAYTPSTGFADFTQQYMRDNPAPVIARPSVGGSDGTGSPPPTVAPPIDLSQLPVDVPQPPVDTYQPPVDTYEDPYQPPNDTYVPPVDTYEDPYQPPNDTYIPPVDTYEDPYQPANDTYVPPVDTYEDPYQQPANVYQPPVDTYEDPYQPPNDTYIPPVDTYEDPYQQPANVYQPPVDTYEDPYQPPANVYQPPVDTYEDPYQQPANVYQPPVDTYETPSQPPMDTYQPTVYEAPSYADPVSDYNVFGFNGGEDGGKYRDFGTSFGGAGGGFGLDDDLSMQSSFNAGGIASLRSGGYPRRTGQVSGPGTATSDSIPAMLSDGEFVMTAKAVRGAGKGDRRAGAKRMYALMNQLEQNASRG